MNTNSMPAMSIGYQVTQSQFRILSLKNRFSKYKQKVESAEVMGSSNSRDALCYLADLYRDCVVAIKCCILLQINITELRYKNSLRAGEDIAVLITKNTQWVALDSYSLELKDQRKDTETMAKEIFGEFFTLISTYGKEHILVSLKETRRMVYFYLCHHLGISIT